MNRTRSAACALVAAALGLTAFPSLAGAATAGPSPQNVNDLLVADSGSEANRLTVTETSTTIVFEDTGAPLTAQAPCVQETPNRVSCLKTVANMQVHADLGGGNDEAGFAVTPLVVANGEAGNDKLTGGAEDDQFSGGRGNDTLIGGDGSDRLAPGLDDDQVDGGAGNDTVIANDPGEEPFPAADPDADALAGGSGYDVVTYANRAMGITLSANGQPDDGHYQEGDNIATDVEELQGSAGDDVIFARGSNHLVKGGPGMDQIYGSEENDQLEGEDGDDSLFGAGGDDFSFGGPGRDTIIPGLGRDDVVAGDGDDYIDTRDLPEGAGIDLAYHDRVNCGEGYDWYYPDLAEFSSIAPSDGCDQVTAPRQPPVDSGTPATVTPPTTTTTPPVTAPRTVPPVAALGAKSATARGSSVSIPLRCAANAGADCKSTLRLMSGKKVLAEGKATVKKGRKGTAKLKLTSAGRKLRRKRAVKVTVVATPSGGKAKTLGTLKLTVR